MIGIIGAMQMEIQGLQAMLEGPERQTISGITFTTGRLRGQEVVLAVCGVGKVFAALCAQTMILRFGVTAVINTGVAGTLCRELSIGDVAISDQVMQHDMDTSPVGDPVCMISGIEQIYLPADPRLVELISSVVREQGLRYLVGTIATGDQFLSSRARKDWIRQNFGAIAAEMEGGSIGQVCHVNAVPFVIIRTISDDDDGSTSPDYAAFAAEAAQSAIRITAAVLEKMSHE